MKGRAISSSIAWALLGLGFLACAWSGRVTSSGMTNAQPQGLPGVAPGNQCFSISSTCATSHDCCSQVCQNGYCEEQNGL